MFGELLRPHRHVPSPTSAHRASLGPLLPRRPLLFPSRALVSPHCSLRHEFFLTGVNRAHRRRGQSFLVHLRPRLFLLSLPLASLLLNVNLYWVAVAPACWRTAAPPFSTARHPRCSRARESYLNRCGRERRAHGALGCHRDLAVVEFSGGEASALTMESLTRGSPLSASIPLSPYFCFWQILVLFCKIHNWS